MDLVTGATGLVGSHVLLELLARGRDVRALHRAGSDRELVRRVFMHYRPDGDALCRRIDWMECEVADPVGLEEAMRGVEHLYHCAALVSFDARDAKRMLAVNIGGTANVVNAALEAGVKVFVHVSSIATIGSALNGAAMDETLPFDDDRRQSPYAISKHGAELEVQRGVAEGLRAVIVNPSVILGAGDPSRGSLAIIGRLRKGSRFYATGSVGVVDARDVAWAMAELAVKGVSGDRYILSTPSIGYRELFTRITSAFGRGAPTMAAPAWGLRIAWRADRLRTLFGGRSLITRHTVRSALSDRNYSSAKVEGLLGMRFRGAEEAVRNACAFMGA